MSDEELFRKAVYLTGPTASGKTAVGVSLAHRLGAEVLAMDSMTLYRGMDIGTAKPGVEERRGITHHLIDVIEPWEAASVAQYREWAGAVLRNLDRRGVPALFVGGTPLYLKVLLRGLFEGPAADEERRLALEELGREIGNERLHKRLAEVDPVLAARLHPNDRRRVIRGLEVFEATGRPLSSWQNEHERPAEGVRVVAIGRHREALHRRIDERVLGMMEGGLVEEVERLAAEPRGISDVAAQGVGYREVLDLLAGRLAGDEVVPRIQARTRQFAKRQETWFRGLAEVKTVAIGEGETAEEVAGRIEGMLMLK